MHTIAGLWYAIVCYILYHKSVKIGRVRLEFALEEGGDFVEDDFRTGVDGFMWDAVIMMVNFVDGAVEGILHVEAKFFRDCFDGSRGGAFDFGVGRKLGPGVDGNFDIAEAPDFAEGGLVGFEAEAGGLEDGDGVVVITDGDVGFAHAVEGEVVDLFISHDDLNAFIADAEEGVGAGVEDNAAHEDFGFSAGGAEIFELGAVGGFVDVEEGGFKFFIQHQENWLRLQY